MADVPAGTAARADGPSEQDWAQAAALLRAVASDGGTVVIVGHVDPDADALGSLLALRRWLMGAGARVFGTWGSDPFEPPSQLDFLPGFDELVPAEQVPADPDLLIAVDFSSVGRLGLLAPVAESATSVLVIDHHQPDHARPAGAEPFGDVLLVDPDASSTVALAERLLRELGAELDVHTATCLYAGLVTDTGRFQYANVDPETFELGARLKATGIDHSAIARRLFETHSLGYLELLRRVLERVGFDEQRGLLHTWFSDDDVAECGVNPGETEAVIDVVRTVDRATIAVVGKRFEGEWKVSMRSEPGGVDVSRIAARLDGGGHRNAAGATFGPGTYEQLLAAVVDALDDIVAEVD